MRDPRHIAITGASSGIGAALAAHYARPGIRLALAGRSETALAAVAADCRARGADVVASRVDVTDAASIAAWLESAAADRPLDLVIANAGISGGTGPQVAPTDLREPPEQAAAILAVNVGGVVDTVHPALRIMLRQGRGQVAIMSSIASFRGFAGAPSYCASKAMVRVWGEALRVDYAPHGIEIAVICPGYVKSPMTDANDFPMPFLMPAARAARIISRGLAANRARIVFPLRLYWLLRVLTALPEPLLDRIMARLPRKRGLRPR
ncbi:MAG: SDR family NAD(P)-dependent oxidoreductase [Alphaproteobacteria bacterium]|nr:SDR family NAD(P)-dependent oxidoreductase [Alphaproteobacteria bacterium]